MSLDTLVLPLLLLVSITTASHFWGGTISFTSKGRNPDGSYRVDFRYTYTMDLCIYHLHWSNCRLGNCGNRMNVELGKIDDSNGRYSYHDNWCQNAGVMTRSLWSDKPFELTENSCCWVYLSNSLSYWDLPIKVDLGVRSDTNEPNHSPHATIISFVSVPQNCPRTYNFIGGDPDGDKIRCQSLRSLPSGFIFDQDTCTLSYTGTGNTGSYGFEFIVKDYPRQHINLTYSDGTTSFRGPVHARRRRQSPWGSGSSTTASATAIPFTTRQHNTPSWLSTFVPTTRTTTTGRPTTPPWWWGGYQNTIAPSTNPWSWLWPHHTQSTTVAPTTMSRPRSTASTNPPTTWWPQPQTTVAPTAAPVVTTNPWLHYGTPLSQIPLQFVVRVDYAASSCNEGVYLPRFLHPTPSDKEHLHVGLNQELEIRVNATSSHSVVHDLIISGPLNITKDRTTSGEFVLRWTPRADDLDQHFPICFIAESKWGSRFFQSEMRCVVVEVEHHLAPQANVICTDHYMAIELETSISENIKLHVDHLRLNDPSCTLYSNGSHVFANMSLNTCGTELEEDENYLFFKNEISTFDHPNDIITRINQVEFQFFCKYPKKNSVTLEFDTHRGPYVFTQKGFGTFSYQFEFYQSSQFQYPKNPNSYPLEFGLGQMMYMQIEGISSVNNTELFLESCRASPTENSQSTTFYTIIENGCKKDDTVQFYSNRDSKVQFGMKAFKFIGWHDQVFITCSVILCEAGNPSTRCSQGCTNATAPPAVHHHHRREAPIQTNSHYISQGPVRLSRSADIRDASSTVVTNGLNMNLVFIAGCVLIVAAMVCGAVIYTKRPKIAYQSLPTSDF